MVVAYLRGFLKPSIKYGLRSIVSENYVFEMLAAENHASLLEAVSLSDAAILPAMTADSKRETMRTIRRRLQRATSIRNGALYGATAPKENGQISLYQLYQLCAKSGILETLTSADTTNANG